MSMDPTSNCIVSNNTSTTIALFQIPVLSLFNQFQDIQYGALLTFLIISVTLITTLCIKRYYAYYILKYKSNIPTVFYKPKFINYTTTLQETTKLSSSTITNILPRMYKLNSNCYGIYGTIYGISTKIVHVAHPTPARVILSSSSKKEPSYNHFKNFCGNGVFTSDGTIWKLKRNSVSYCLKQRRYNRNSRMRVSGKSMKSIDDDQDEDVIKETMENYSTNNHILSLEEIVYNAIQDFTLCINQQKQKNSDSIQVNDVVPTLQRITLSIIYQYLTHQKIDIIPKDPQQEKSTSLLSKYLESIIKIRMIVLAQSRSIWFLLPNIFYKLFSPMYKEEEYVCNFIRAFAKNAYSHNNPTSCPLHLLKLLHCKNKSMYYDYTTCDLDIEHETITLLFAGQDTSAATMSWILHLLSIYPDKQYKLLQEMNKKNGDTITYLDAVIKEAMRLYPVAPFVVRQLTDDVSIPNENHDSTTTLYKGTFACIWIYGMHHNKHLWKNPSDFIPERWLEVNNKDAGIEEGAFMPFAIGPRNCLGQSIANVVVRNMLKGILSRYLVLHPKLNDADSPTSSDYKNSLRKDMQAGFTVLPLGGVPLVLKPYDYSLDNVRKMLFLS